MTIFHVFEDLNGPPVIVRLIYSFFLQDFRLLKFHFQSVTLLTSSHLFTQHKKISAASLSTQSRPQAELGQLFIINQNGVQIKKLENACTC